MANNLISASVGRITRIRMSRGTQENSIIINGTAYRIYTWAALEKDARSPGIHITYQGTEARLEDDGSCRMFRTFQICKTGSFTAALIAIEA